MAFAAFYKRTIRMRKKDISPVTNSVLNTEWSDKESALVQELANARPSDISHRHDLTKKNLMKTALSKAIRYTAMLLCLLVFLGASGYIASYAIQYMEKKQQDDYFEDLGDGKIKTKYAQISSKNTGNTATMTLGQTMEDVDIGPINIDHSGTYNEYFEKKRAQFVGLQRMYPDVWGWIDVPGTKVNYIVVQGKTNTDYLYTEYNGKYTRYGSIFLDFRNNRNVLSNRNMIIYGHNMNTARIMFAPLLDFATDEEAFRNQVINIITPDGLYTYELFSIYDTYSWDNYIQTTFENDEEFIDFCKRCQKKSIFKKDVSFTKDSRLLTLSTCTVRGDGMRWALHAVLVGVPN